MFINQARQHATQRCCRMVLQKPQTLFVKRLVNEVVSSQESYEFRIGKCQTFVQQLYDTLVYRQANKSDEPVQLLVSTYNSLCIIRARVVEDDNRFRQARLTHHTIHCIGDKERTEEHRVGKDGVRTCRAWWSAV